MTLQFSHDERAYIVDNCETDLLLTEAGLKLVDNYIKSDELVCIEVSENDHDRLIRELRDEFLWKSQRLGDPRILIQLARRFLQDFESLEPTKF